MERRPLGSTGERLSALCMGCWEIGGLAWGPMAAPEAVRLVQAAFDGGITTFDTAEAYGNGRSEVVLGHALKGRRDQAFIISKTGYLIGIDGAQVLFAAQPQNFSPASIEKACEQALRRLQTTYIDAYLLHDPPMHIVVQEEPFRALERLQQAGKIRWWGVSANAAQATEAIRRWGAPVVETPFNALSPDAARVVFPPARERGTGVLARSPFASGALLLSPHEAARLHPADWRQGAFQQRIGPAAPVRERLATLADRRDEPPTATAVRFVLAHPEVSTCIVGLTQPDEIAPNTSAAAPPYLSPLEVTELVGP
ncbi:MAG: aldo/keto reductase [Actinobacteria bacterium]|nr:aldo/keto reductase [Actinomycetota bacterium]